MFNERDQRCAAVQLMLSTDPSYDNRTIASTLKMQIWIATNNRDVPRVMKMKFLATVISLWRSFKWGPHHATSHLQSRLESQHQSIPGCAEECCDPLVQSGGRWDTLGVAAGLGAGPQVQRDPGLAWLRLCNLLSLAPSSPKVNPLDYFVWSYIENITNMTSRNPKASLIAVTRRVFAELPPSIRRAPAEYSPSSRRRLWKRHAPSSGCVSRRWLRLKAATLNRCQIYYIIKLPELTFSIKIFK